MNIPLNSFSLFSSLPVVSSSSISSLASSSTPPFSFPPLCSYVVANNVSSSSPPLFGRLQSTLSGFMDSQGTEPRLQQSTTRFVPEGGCCGTISNYQSQSAGDASTTTGGYYVYPSSTVDLGCTGSSSSVSFGSVGGYSGRPNSRISSTHSISYSRRTPYSKSIGEESHSKMRIKELERQQDSRKFFTSSSGNTGPSLNSQEHADVSSGSNSSLGHGIVRSEIFQDEVDTVVSVPPSDSGVERNIGPI